MSKEHAMPEPVSAHSPNFSRRRSVRKPAARAECGIVVAQNRVAAEIGARVLKAGGHAADAAVATAFAIGVAEPWMSGIGGVGGAVVLDRRSGRTTGIDFGGVSPLALDPADFKLRGEGADSDLFGWPLVEGNLNTSGAKAMVTPSEPAGLALLHKSFGRKPWAELVLPAARLAEEGPVLDWCWTLAIAEAMGDLRRDPGAAALFLPGGLPPAAPAAVVERPLVRLPRPALARTLRTIAEEGVEPFYHGAIARQIAEDAAALGGYLGLADLAACAPRLVDPLTVDYRGHRMHMLPELNGGPTLAVAWRALQEGGGAYARSGKVDAAALSAYASALDVGWRHRLAVMGDAGERAAPTSTTHLAVIDRDGNIVTLTQTLLSLFGSRVLLPRTGILMNNGINWFDPRPGGPNALAPGRRVLANYAPAIMTASDGLAIGIGGCGGRKILPAVFQLLSMICDFGLDLEAAFHHPRIDHSGGRRIVADGRLGADVIAELARSHEVAIAEPTGPVYPFTLASAVARRDGVNQAATEPAHPWSDAVTEEEV
jgi:gamma-glutamyltranspeptidase/glutathione hydrolase